MPRLAMTNVIDGNDEADGESNEQLIQGEDILTPTSHRVWEVSVCLSCTYFA